MKVAQDDALTGDDGDLSCEKTSRGVGQVSRDLVETVSHDEMDVELSKGWRCLTQDDVYHGLRTGYDTGNGMANHMHCKMHCAQRTTLVGNKRSKSDSPCIPARLLSYGSCDNVATFCQWHV
jgi:hypothetical protein